KSRISYIDPKESATNQKLSGNDLVTQLCPHLALRSLFTSCQQTTNVPKPTDSQSIYNILPFFRLFRSFLPKRSF
ncbi:MAG: hypothetical protein SNG14_02195, partial [Rikenellaceae bacterium]